SPSTNFVPATVPWQRGEDVHVRIHLWAGGVPEDLAARGLVIERRAGDVVEGWVPRSHLRDLAGLAGVRTMDPVRRARVRPTADGPSRATLARATGIDGTGVVGGILSDGAGTLPASAVPAGCDRGSGSEGQALADVVHTPAPGATLLFASGENSSLA